MTNGISNRLMNFAKPRSGELWREKTGQVVEIIDVGMKYATVKSPGGDSRFKRMVKFNDFLGKFIVDPTPPPPPQTISEEELDEEFFRR